MVYPWTPCRWHFMRIYTHPLRDEWGKNLGPTKQNQNGTWNHNAIASYHKWGTKAQRGKGTYPSSPGSSPRLEPKWTSSPSNHPGWGVKILYRGGQDHFLPNATHFSRLLLPFYQHPLLPPFWPTCDFQNVPSILSPSPPGWCLYCSLCLDCFPPILLSLHVANVHSFLHSC